MINISAVVASEAPDETEKDSSENEAPMLPGEQRLWLAVLNQALADATLTDPMIDGRDSHKRDDLRKQRNISRAWLTQRSRDLDTVCSHAGIDLDSFLIYARG